MDREDQLFLEGEWHTSSPAPDMDGLIDDDMDDDMDERDDF